MNELKGLFVFKYCKLYLSYQDLPEYLLFKQINTKIMYKATHMHIYFVGEDELNEMCLSMNKGGLCKHIGA